MSSAIIETRMNKTSVKFSTKFTGLLGFPSNVGDYVTSPIFELKSFKFCLRIYCGGYDNTNRGNIACMIEDKSDTPRLNRLSYKLILQNQKKNFQNKEFSSNGVVDFNNDNNFIQRIKNLLPQSELKNNSNGIIVDDSIIIKCELTIYSQEEYLFRDNVEIIKSDFPLINGSSQRNNFSNSILMNLQQAYNNLNNEDLSTADIDFVIAINDEPLNIHGLIGSNNHIKPKISTEKQQEPQISTKKQDFYNQKLSAHSFILCLRSPVFSAMLNKNMLEKNTKEIHITDINYNVMKELICYMYTDTCSEESIEKYSDELLGAACKYQIIGLENICSNYLVNQLSIDTAVNTLILADLYDAKELKKRCLYFISEHAKSIMQLEGDNFFIKLGFHLCQDITKILVGIKLVDEYDSSNDSNQSSPLKSQSNGINNRYNDDETLPGFFGNI